MRESIIAIVPYLWAVWLVYMYILLGSIHILTHSTKRCFKHSRLIIKDLVSKGNQTPDCWYNDSMIIMPPAQTSCSNLLLYCITLNQHIVFTVCKFGASITALHMYHNLLT